MSVATASWERARTPEQKEVRIVEIIEATARLFEHKDFEKINLAMIAREAEFTRSNLYKYFGSKEEIFLELIRRDSEKWFLDLKQTLGNDRLDSETFARLWVEVQSRHQRLVKLLPLKYTIIQEKAPREALANSQQAYLTQTKLLVSLLKSIFEEITEDLAASFFHSLKVVVLGTRPLMATNSKQKQAMEANDITNDKGYIEKLYFNTIKALIDNVLVRAREEQVVPVA